MPSAKKAHMMQLNILTMPFKMDNLKVWWVILTNNFSNILKLRLLLKRDFRILM